MDGQVTWSDLGILCGKMFVAHTAATEDETSTPCWKKLRVSQNQDFLYLDCRKSGNGQKQEPLTVMGGLSLGELTTLKTGEKPSETAVQEMLSVWGPHSVAEESRLSQILEETPHPKYNLTAKACQGILRRAERRGKDLPKLLKEVLIRQAQGASPQERTEAPAPTEVPTSYAVRIRGGCDGGGKGALVQTEKSGTLGTGNDQTIFCMATQQGGAELRTDDRAPTLTAAAGMSGNNQPVVAIPINDKATRWQGGGESRNHDGGGNGLGIGKEGDSSPTLTAGDRHGVLCAGFKAGQGAQAGGIGYSEEVSPTLAAAPSGTNQTPAVVTVEGCDLYNAKLTGDVAASMTSAMAKGGSNTGPTVMCLNDQGGSMMGVSHDVSGTLRAQEHGHQPVVAYSFDSLSSNSMKSKNPHSGCREVDVAKTLDTTDPTPSKNQGGIAVVAPAVALDMTHACDVIRECGNQVPLTYQMNGFGDYRAAEVASSCKQRDFKDSTDLVCAVDCRNFREGGEVNGTLQAKESGGQSLNLNNTVRQNMVVRRLTPLECERLQGFPDGWTDIGEWTDEKGKKHKDADSPKYKALGNSIALPFWDWMLRRMARYLPEDATLGSLFDGISGFNVCWARIHGAEHCRWSSEIEQFPIAVTKKHFGDEKSGEKGDWEIFLGGMT